MGNLTVPETMKPRDRLAYSAIVDRPKLKLPDNGRIAIWTIVNVEEWSIDHPHATRGFIATNGCADATGCSKLGMA